ncbi:MAG: type II toxin-antitoxin system Phd/YefM family antitoxin [Bdellovibrionota bacterium]
MDKKKSIAISEFKQKCLSIIDNLSSEGLIITKHGKEIAVIKPFSNTHAHLIGSLEDEIEIKGDLLSTGVKWNAES